MGKRILAIDDEEMILDAMKLILEDMGYEMDVFSDPVEGEKAALEKDYDLILLDLRMPQKNGAELTESIKQAKPDCRILIITAYPNDPLAERALKAGASSLLKKPFEIAKIVDLVAN